MFKKVFLKTKKCAQNILCANPFILHNDYSIKGLKKMIDKLKSVEKRFLEINDQLSLPEVVSDNEKFKKLMKEHKTLTPIVETFRAYCAAESSMQEAKEMLCGRSAC